MIKTQPSSLVSTLNNSSSLTTSFASSPSPPPFVSAKSLAGQAAGLIGVLTQQLLLDDAVLDVEWIEADDDDVLENSDDRGEDVGRDDWWVVVDDPLEKTE